MRQLVDKYQPYFPAAFFIGGFVFDLLTTARIDETFQLLQQFLYLLVIGFFLVFEKSPRLELFFATGFRAKIWHYKTEAVHFLLGALLSVYMIFYFKSASPWNSFLFVGSLAALLVLNEFERIKGLGDIIRFSLFSLCSVSYFVYLVPILWHQIGFFTFLFSLIIAAIFMVFFFYLLSKYEHLPQSYLLKNIVTPAMLVPVIFFFLYAFHVLPPVPLSLEKIGVYHDIKKSGKEYELSYDRPSWKFWENGAQSFIAMAGDKVFCFASIFAPDFFADRVTMEWWQKRGDGWTKTDSIPMQVVGGREKGFRGYTVKTNYEGGEWQVRVVTSDHREIGRIYFSIDKTGQMAPVERAFTVDRF
ncbi:MAG: DUF2914 domain-containing protein [Bdellovibrionaceae bacterium]|nr:DUF2914 domain-containing protein [Pseudobdellovibrionaceae bacterium]